MEEEYKAIIEMQREAFEMMKHACETYKEIAEKSVMDSVTIKGGGMDWTTKISVPDIQNYSSIIDTCLKHNGIFPKSTGCSKCIAEGIANG
jgi:hypothetical protein